MSQPQSADQIHVFGVRHLSPAGAWHLRQFLDRVQPQIVLIEGLSDAGNLIPDITGKQSIPPLAILAYTDAVPVRTLVYPFARYSPEYQALQWSREHHVQAEFIDLPSDVFLALGDQQRIGARTQQDSELAEKPDTDSESETTPSPTEPAGLSVYDQYAQRAGEPNYETYWERHFEHNLLLDSYRLAAVEFGHGLRQLEQETDAPRRQAETLIREAFMRRRIQQTIAAGIPPEKIVAVVGAYHASVLGSQWPAMSDDELASLPRRSSLLTLMPYSYFKLSSQSGYGAGNHAPAYFELLWEALEDGQLQELPARYLSLVARNLRQSGTHRSTAEVIESVRLARTLSALKGGLAPALADLQDAAVTLIGQGDRGVVQESLLRVEVGTAIGRLPDGVSRTSIQDDFNRQLRQLKLEKYRSGVRQELGLDLRENRQVKSVEAAFLDLHRSAFLHRLRVLKVAFAEPLATGQSGTTWAEKWVLRWTPESEIDLVEAVLLGETVEVATGYKFKIALDECVTVADAADLVEDAVACGLLAAMEQARQRLQALAAETSSFTAVAHAAHRLGMIVRYGDVRQFDPAPLLPLIDDLFVQGAVALVGAANCDQRAAADVVRAMDQLNQVNLEHHERVDEPLWIDKLRELSDADDRNPQLSGYACAILLERNLISNEQLAREVSRRLSPGIAADLGAGWFEGIARRNRYALLARQPLWEQLAEYVQALDDDQFRRAIVYLRRAFGTFSPQEKRHIAENLGEHWGTGSNAASEMINQPLTEQETEILDELNEFDFDDL